MNNAAQLSIFDGPALRDQGMQQAVEHAEQDAPGWTTRALAMLEACPLQRFMVEELRAWAYANGLDRAVNDRAWGAVITKAAKLGLVMHNGYQSVSNPRAHCTPASCWRKVGSLKHI
jgi:hypothetical protein